MVECAARCSTRRYAMMAQRSSTNLIFVRRHGAAAVGDHVENIAVGKLHHAIVHQDWRAATAERESARFRVPSRCGRGTARSRYRIGTGRAAADPWSPARDSCRRTCGHPCRCYKRYRRPDIRAPPCPPAECGCRDRRRTDRFRLRCGIWAAASCRPRPGREDPAGRWSIRTETASDTRAAPAAIGRNMPPAPARAGCLSDSVSNPHPTTTSTSRAHAAQMLAKPCAARK